MVYVPDPYTLTDAQRQAIGALTHDAGVRVHMDYTSTGSSAAAADVPTALMSTFGYTNAVSGLSMTTIPTASLTHMINPNLDAGLPVLLGIYRPGGGHAVVGDGYGFDAATLYHHLNMGWSGSNDAWYNLPTVNTGTYNYNEVGDCIYNIFKSGTGEIISGRVLNALGQPVNGATVTAGKSGGGQYTASTNSQGIYALAGIPGDSTYTIQAAKSGNISPSRTASTGTSFNFTTVTGNLWGVDLTLSAAVTQVITPILQLLLND